MGAPRERSCARRERWGRLGFRAFARGGSGCRRSYARSGPIPLRFGVFGRSAGTVLRALRKLGRGLGFRALREGVFVVRLQGSLRTDPATLGVWGAPRDRSCARRERWGRLGFRAFARGGSGCRRSYARSGPIPLRFGVFGRSAGTVLRALRRLWGGGGFRALREGFLLFASKARCGPIPLRLAYGALRGNGPALAEEALGRIGLSRVARGGFVVRLQGSLRTDPAPLRVWGAPRERSCARTLAGRLR